MGLRINSLAVSVGGIIRLVVNLVAIPILVRLLGINSYGVWTTIIAQISLLALAEMGVSTALLYRLSSYLVQKDEAAFYKCIGTALILITTFGTIFSLVYLAFLPLIAKTFHGFATDSALLTSLKISSLILLPKIWALFFSSIEASHQRYDMQAIIETSTTVILQIGIIFLAWQKASFSAMLLWLLVSSMLGVLAHILVSSKVFKINFTRIIYSKNEANGLLNFGIQHWVSSLGSSLFGQMDRILVNAILGPTIAGVYSAATSLTMKINELSAIPIKVITPSISAEKTNGNYSMIRRIFFKATRLNGFVVLLVALPLIFWADFVATIVVSGETAASFSAILPLLACIYGIYSLGASGFFLMLGLGKPKVNAIWGIIGGLALCALLTLLSHRLGISGAVWANAAYIMVIFINFYGVKLLEIKLSDYSQVFFRSVLILIAWSVLVNFFPPSGMTIGLRLIVFFTAGAVSLVFTLGLEETKALPLRFKHRFLHHGINHDEVKPS